MTAQQPPKKFEIAVTLNVQELKNGTLAPFFQNTLNYHDVGYDGLMGIEHYLIDALANLNQASVAAGVQMGLGDKLSAFEAFRDKVKELSSGGGKA